MNQTQAAPVAEALPSLAYRSYFLLIMTLVSASVVGERYMMVVLVEPIRKELMLSDTAIGMVKDLAIAVVYILAVLPLARLADKWSKRKIVATSALIWSLAVIVCGLAKNFWMLLIGRSGIGLGSRYGPARDEPGVVAAWRFDLDHVGTHVGHDLRGIGPEHHARQIDQAKARERPGMRGFVRHGSSAIASFERCQMGKAFAGLISPGHKAEVVRRGC
jgi:hypothetical protein